ncbi:MAG TPA: hypothetical protein DDW52_15355 [Planctomycetaceae bacterium]|nr:hypothetical protein [Planctomycetaceae bacterium]
MSDDATKSACYEFFCIQRTPAGCAGYKPNHTDNSHCTDVEASVMHLIAQPGNLVQPASEAFSYLLSR